MTNKYNKAAILEKLSKTFDLEEIFDFFLSHLSGIDSKIFYFFQPDKLSLKAYKASFSKRLAQLEQFYKNVNLIIADYPVIGKCLTSLEVKNVNLQNLQKQDSFTRSKFNSQNIVNSVYFPIHAPGREVIGILILNQEKHDLSENTIQLVRELLGLFYYAFKNGIVIKNYEEANREIETNREKYQLLLKLAPKLNMLMEPHQVFRALIGEFNTIFKFELGFVQMEKQNRLPILAGAAIDEEKSAILNRLIEYFGEWENAPLIKGPLGPEAASCAAYLFNSHFYCYDTSILKNIGMTEKDKYALSLLGKPLKTFIQIPIRHESHPMGVMQLWSFEENVRLSDMDIEVMSSLATFIPSVLKNAEMHSLIKRQHYQFQSELKLARNIQQKLIPLKPPQIPGLSLASLYKPMEAIGGDFYDFLKVREPNFLGIFISDVSGHGVPAALITSMVKTLLETAGPKRLFPNRLLSYINEKLMGQTGDNFLTAFYGIYDMKKRLFKYARAAHNYPVLLRQGKMIELESHGKMLGVMHDIHFEEKEIELLPGDKILFYTDGLTEATNAQGEEFGDYLPDILSRFCHLPIEEFIHSIYHELLSFREEYQFDDDVCIVGMAVDDG